MARIKPADRYKLFRSIQEKFETILDTFPDSLEPSIIRSYEREDFDSPGLLSLAALPYWIGDRYKIPHQVCHEMAVGNLFLLHSFQSFDFIVDNDRPDTSTRSQIVLGNLCLLQVMDHYRPYFPSDSPFWERLEAYWREWGESMLWEVESENSRRPFSKDCLLISAHKAAALKICPVGLALLADKTDLIPRFESAIDLMHATMQLQDDLTDWREDLIHRRYNSLLGMIWSDNGDRLDSNNNNSLEDVSTVLFNSDILDRYIEVIRVYAHQAIAVINTLNIEPWAMLMRGLVGQASHSVGIYKQIVEAYLPER